MRACVRLCGVGRVCSCMIVRAWFRLYACICACVRACVRACALTSVYNLVRFNIVNKVSL